MKKIEFLEEKKSEKNKEGVSEKKPQEKIIWSEPKKDKPKKKDFFSFFSFFKKKNNNNKKKKEEEPKKEKNSGLLRFLGTLKKEKESRLTGKAEEIPLKEPSKEENKIKKEALKEIEKPQKKFNLLSIFKRQKPEAEKDWKKEETTRLPADRQEKKESKKKTALPEKTDEKDEWAGVKKPGTNLIKGQEVIFFDWKLNITFSVVLAILSCAIVAGGWMILDYINRQYKNEIDKFIENQKALEVDIAKTEDQMGEVFKLQEKVKLAKKLLDDHIYWTNFLKLLEKNTVNTVFLLDFEGRTESISFGLAAFAKDYASIAKQIQTLRENEGISNVRTKGGSKGKEKSGSAVLGRSTEGLVSFDILLDIDENFLKK